MDRLAQEMAEWADSEGTIAIRTVCEDLLTPVCAEGFRQIRILGGGPRIWRRPEDADAGSDLTPEHGLLLMVPPQVLPAWIYWLQGNLAVLQNAGFTLILTGREELPLLLRAVPSLMCEAKEHGLRQIQPPKPLGSADLEAAARAETGMSLGQMRTAHRAGLYLPDNGTHFWVGLALILGETETVRESR